MLVEKNLSLIASLDVLRLDFSQLDRTTGTVDGDYRRLGEAQRSVSATWEDFAKSWAVSLDVPERVEAGYWRGAGMLQLAFWKGKEPSLRFSTEDDEELGGELECISLSQEGLHLRFRGAVTPIFVRVTSCL